MSARAFTCLMAPLQGGQAHTDIETGYVNP